MDNTYKPSWVANAFLKRAKEEGIKDLTPMKIQKLVYCFHGWHLATTNKPAIGEMYEAWPYGPVLSSLYHEFKSYRDQPIVDYAVDYVPETDEYKAYIPSMDDVSFYNLFEAVWERYKKLSGLELSQMTHAPGSPWSFARNASHQYIDDNNVLSHFRGIAEGAG